MRLLVYKLQIVAVVGPVIKQSRLPVEMDRQVCCSSL